MSTARFQMSRKNRLSVIGAVLLVIALGTTAAVVVGTRRLASPPAAAPTAPAAAGGASALVIDGLQQTAARDGVTEWILNAGAAVFLQEEKKFLLTEPRVTFFRAEGQTFFLSAAKGTVATERHDMDAEGDVVIRNERYRARTERVRYTHAERMISSDRPVAITGDRGEITADTGSVDVRANRMRLAGNVQGLVPAGTTASDRETLQIASDRLRVDMDGDWAEFSGRVRLDQKSTTTTADTLTVHYTRPAEHAGAAAGAVEEVTLTRIVARGSVTVKTEDGTAEADEAVYEPAAGTLTLIGRPATVKSASAVVRGARVVISPRTRHMSAESGTAGRVSVVWRAPASRP